MSRDTEQMQVDFHNKASGILFAGFHAFERAIEGIDRSTEEYRFQHLKQQYCTTLQHHLRTAALDILMEYKNEEQSGGVSQILHQLTKDYLHQFVRKANAL